MADIYKSKYTGEQIEEMLDNASKVSNIVPNPDAEGTTPLTKITIGDVVYVIPEGVTVTPNPDTDATEALSKLQIGDVVYSIGGGGGETHSYQIVIGISGTDRTFYFESPYLIESVDDIKSNYSVSTGKRTLPMYGNGSGWSISNGYFLAYFQIGNNSLSFYYFKSQRVTVSSTNVQEMQWGGGTWSSSSFPVQSITRLT